MKRRPLPHAGGGAGTADAAVQFLDFRFLDLHHVVLFGLVSKACREAALRYLHTLSSLDFSPYQKLINRAVLVLRSSPHVSRVSVAGCTLLRPDRVMYDNIQHLDVSNCRQLTDAHVEHIAQSASRLVSFSCANCIKVTDAGLMPLITTHHNALVHLDLANTSISDVIADAIATCVNLRFLSVAHPSHQYSLPSQQSHAVVASFTDTGLLAIASSCLLLESVNLDGRVRITSRGVLGLRGITSLTRLNLSKTAVGDALFPHLSPLPWPALVDLNLCGLSAQRAAAGVSDASLGPFLAACRHLERVDLSANMAITDATINRLLHGSATTLRCVYLTRTSISWDAIWRLASDAPHLRELVVARCPKLTGFKAKAKQFHQAFPVVLAQHLSDQAAQWF
ncbi:Aste57867_14400 [Aphanomyces stellatus]|uniref:Aste57867_14400 protein n=1 Tax=Aphanomyces stellatus TaxID=120398 RepID=A0A485L0I6_9STRA|nr:hypothetical protein As57867_014346 [Aphanomyces stellatus]VFT91222.1 Aste57867_14400 [Aphanomyces stellatus]